MATWNMIVGNEAVRMTSRQDFICRQNPERQPLLDARGKTESGYYSRPESLSEEGVAAVLDWLHQAGSLLVRRNREQIIETFPLLLPALALRRIEPEFIAITAVIDNGLSLIDAVASLAGVKKKSIRFLRGKKLSLVGKVWGENPFALFRAIDAIPDHRRPMNSREWRLFSAFWQCSHNATLSTRYDTSDLGELGWHLFVEFCTGGYSNTEKTLRQYLYRESFWRDFSAFVRHVGQWCEKRARELDFNNTVAGVAKRQIAFELLTHFPAKKLLELTEQWQQNIICNRPHVSRIVHWPALLPEPVFCDGLTVISLTDSFQLFKESESLNHCVPRYISACLLGHSHILAIRDESGESLSTVEITLVEDHAGDLIPIIVQHRGPSNSEPDIACVRALTTAIHRLLEPGNQIWFREMAARRSERAQEINRYLVDRDDDASVDAVAEVMPDFEQVEDWLKRRLIDEELWHCHRRDQVEDS
jgi:hypothetical protein